MDDVSDLGGLVRLFGAIAAFVIFLAMHVTVGYVRQARVETRRPRILFFAAVAAAALGLGVWAATVLALAGQPVAYALGFRAVVLVAVVLLALGMAGVAVLIWTLRATLTAVVAGGVVIGLAPLAVLWLMVRAAGLEPGVQWSPEITAIATALMLVAGVAGFSMAFLIGGQPGKSRRPWRWFGAAVVAVALPFGLDLLASSIEMGMQVDSAYAHQVPATALTVFAGGLLPLALLIMAFDLGLRRSMMGAGPMFTDPRGKRRRTRRSRQL